MNGRTRLFLAALAALLAPGFVPAARPAEAQSLVEHVGTLTVPEPPFAEAGFSGSLLLNPKSRRGYIVQSPPGIRPLIGEPVVESRLTAFDLDTLQTTGTITVPHALYSFASDALAAVDEDGRRLFFARLKAQGDQALTGFTVVDEATGEITDQPLPPDLQALGLKVGGISYSPAEDRLYLLVRQIPSPLDPESNVNQTVLTGLGSPRVFVLSWNPTTGERDQLRFLRSCRSLFPTENASGHYLLPVFSSRFEAAVWVGCSNNQGGFINVRVARDQLADPAGVEDVFPGPERVRDAFGDPGSDRIIARYSVGTGESWWVFDGRRRSYVGVIGATRTKDRGDYAGGIDPSTGRLYLQYPGTGLLVSDARRTPVPQALVFPEIEKGPTPLRVAVDPLKRHIFIPNGGQNGARTDRYDIYRDLPPVGEPPPPNPDSNTVDIAEEEGKTGVNFTGVAQGYGARALLVGGIFGVVPPGPGAEDARPIRSLLINTNTQCGPRDRELVAGLVEQSELGNSIAGVRALAARLDEATVQDLLQPSRCDVGPDLGPPLGRSAYPGLPAPLADTLDTAARNNEADKMFTSQECSGDEGKKESASRGPVQGLRALAECKQSDAVVRAEAGGPALEGEDFTVAEALSRTRITRTARNGVVSQVYSVARGVNIAGGLVTIDAVEAWAESSANGRAKNDARDDTATTRFVRRVTGMKVRNPDGALVFSCEHCVRDLLTGVGQANAALAGRAEIRLPMPDPVLLSGTPGGFQAAVQKNRFEAIADNSLNNDPSKQVPGLEVVIFNDSPELRARQVLQFAGVASSASYGIYLLDQSSDFPSPPVIPDAEPLPPGVEVLSDAVGGTTVSETNSDAPPSRLENPSLGDRIAELPAALARGAGYMFRHPREAVLATIVWLMIALPIYGFARQRALLKALTNR